MATVQVEQYNQATKEAEKLYQEKIFPEVSQAVGKYFEKEIIPKLDNELESMCEKIRRTGHITPLNYCSVDFTLDSDSKGFYFSFNNINHPFEPSEDYTLTYNVIVKVMREYLQQKGIMLEQICLTAFRCYYSAS